MRKSKLGVSALTAAGLGAAAILGARTVRRSRRHFDFAGKSVLITGGSRGLGLVLARQFASEGATLTLCARNPEQLASAEAELKSRGAEVLAVPCDVTSEPQVQEMVDRATRRFGAVDVVVNNAGSIEVGPMGTMTLADFETAMKVHFWGPLYTTLAVLPQMRQRQAGRIVNISSVGGKIAVPHLLPYSASKFALVGLSEGLRAELQRDNIFVTTVCPGLMRTGSARNALFKGQHRKEFQWFVMGDALPVSSQNAVRAARQIIDACRHGEASAILSLQAKFAVLMHDLFPGLSGDVAAIVNTFLPSAGGIGQQARLGSDSQTPLTRSPLTTLDRNAAAVNNET